LHLEEQDGLYRCLVREQTSGVDREVLARVVIAAHGSWDSGALPTHVGRRSPRPADLFGFKAHLRNCDLPEGLMPLLAFPGGYGGMVHTDQDRVSFSCCIRRDCLAGLRRGRPEDAGEVVLEHVAASCHGLRRALRGATRAGAWLASGPLRPGIRLTGRRGLFTVGNAAGEAHPAVAEGISMAIQAAWLLTRRLTTWHRRHRGEGQAALEAIGRDYAADWRRCFAPRLRAAAVVAHWAMRPAAVTSALPLLYCFPGLLTWGAILSGKARGLEPALLSP
jgi:flavin-dependent dehydrogenase